MKFSLKKEKNDDCLHVDFYEKKGNKRIKKADEEIQELLRGIIDQREKAMKVGETVNDDLLSILMESYYKEIEEY